MSFFCLVAIFRRSEEAGSFKIDDMNEEIPYYKIKLLQ